MITGANGPFRITPNAFLLFIFFLLTHSTANSQVGTWNDATLTGSRTRSLQVGANTDQNTRHITSAVSGLPSNSRIIRVAFAIKGILNADNDITEFSLSGGSVDVCSDIGGNHFYHTHDISRCRLVSTKKLATVLHLC